MAPEVINGESYNEKIDVYSYHLRDISMAAGILGWLTFTYV
eukprot:COSAG01_NODE_48_length_31904_cov_21.696997_27_plen_41_part_00